jgi:hypothetical protein
MNKHCCYAKSPFTSILFQKGYICIAINILLKVVLSIVRFSPYSLNTVFNDQFYFYLPKTLVLIHFYGLVANVLKMH